MILFRCTTFTQLINAINIKITFYKDTEADLILNKTSDFSTIINNIKEIGVFQDIYVSNDDENTLVNYRKIKNKESVNVEDYVSSFLDNKYKKKYTDFFAGTLNEITQLMYYYFSRNNIVKFWVFEEAQISYIKSIYDNFINSGINHKKYGDYSIEKNFKGLYLYEPQLYSAKDKISLYSLPKISKINSNNILNKSLSIIWKTKFSIKEKYIFLEEAFLKDRNITNDIEVLEKFCDIVGKENVIIKLHPRTEFDRFSVMGYKVINSDKTPWEMFLLNCDLSNKIFVTISSNSGIVNRIMYNEENYILELHKLMYIGKNAHLKQKEFYAYYRKLELYMNENRNILFTPKNFDEVEEIIKYAERC